MMAVQFRAPGSRPILSLRPSQQTEQVNAGQPPLAPHDPFVWAEGGKRLTVEQILAQRDLAKNHLASGSDTSPVSHWLQGVDRVVQALMGGFEARSADRAEAANAERSNAVIGALLGTNEKPDIATAARAASDPYMSPEARDTAKFLLDRMVPKPSAAQPYRTKDNAGNVWEQDPQTGAFNRIFTDVAPKQMVANGQLITSTNPFSAGPGLQVTDMPAPGAVIDDPRIADQGGAGLPARSPFAPSPFGFDQFKRAIIGQESGGRYGVPNAEGSGAMGVGQIMPDTARALSARLGLAYRPDLLAGTSAQARRYQDQLTDAAVREAWAAGGSGKDPRMSAHYYFAGSDRRGWGPKTRRYGDDIISRMGAR